MRQNTISVLFNGKSRGLSDLASRQRKDGQWVDNGGVMVLATALYLQRDILVYSQTSADTEELSVTRIEGRGDASEQPLTVFFISRHYQGLRPLTN